MTARSGEKKRIAIAAVLSVEPDLLVLDEPRAGLDPRARRALINLLGELPLTMLVSTHEMLMVYELFARMIIIDEGRIVADDPTDWLMADEALLETIRKLLVLRRPDRFLVVSLDINCLFNKVLAPKWFDWHPKHGDSEQFQTCQVLFCEYSYSFLEPHGLESPFALLPR